MPYADNEGVQVYYEVAGEGTPFVMLHANPCDHRMWMYQISHFARHYRVIALDMRGYGRTDKVETPYSFEELVQDVISVCEQESVTSGILAGASMGSKIAFKLGVDYPDLFQAQIHVGGNSFRGTSYDGRITGYENEDLPPYRANHLKELFAPGFSETDRGRYLSSVILEDSTGLSGKAIGTLFHTFDNVNLSEQVSAIEVPVLIVNGIHDNSLKGGQKTAALIKNAQHETIPDAGHLCILEDPQRFDQLCEGFLHRHELFPPLG
ncbi:MAG: alpha/beta fold hydrolase [Alphaproteobacteria bacterium]|nr:alpha/beta fold hydrolase [Alphaproteobacteria bacterium]